jgi:hypothetical protein
MSRRFGTTPAVHRDPGGSLGHRECVKCLYVLCVHIIYTGKYILVPGTYRTA